MKTQEILSIVALSFLGLCLLCGLAKMAMKKDGAKKNCDKACSIAVFAAVVLLAMSQLIGETDGYEEPGPPTPGPAHIYCSAGPRIYDPSGNPKNPGHNDKCSWKFTGYGCSHQVKFCYNSKKRCKTADDCDAGIGCIATNYCVSCADLCNYVGYRDGDDADCLQSVPKFTIDPDSDFDNGGCTSDESKFTNNPDKFPGGYQKCKNKTSQQPRCSGPIYGVKCPTGKWNFNDQKCE